MKYIFESATKTLLETDNVEELDAYIHENCDELIISDYLGVYETFNYVHINFYGYTLMIKKWQMSRWFLELFEVK